MKKPVVLLIDYNNLIFRALHSHPDLTSNKIFTGGLYGFMVMLAAEVNKHKVDRVVVCHDVKPYHRDLETDGGYKSNRKPLEKDVVKKLQMTKELVFEFLQQVQCANMKKKGWEADDCIANFCRKKHKKCKRILIMSNDSDLYQLLFLRNVYLINSKGAFGYDRFREEFPSITPRDWTKVVALAGGHNGIPGIHSVGVKTAAKMVANEIPLKEIASTYVNAKKGVPKSEWNTPKKGISNKKWEKKQKTKKKIFVDQLKQRRKWARLPLETEDEPPKPPKPRAWKYDKQEFENFLSQYKIRVTPQIREMLSRLSS